MRTNENDGAEFALAESYQNIHIHALIDETPKQQPRTWVLERRANATQRCFPEIKVHTVGQQLGLAATLSDSLSQSFADHNDPIRLIY